MESDKLIIINRYFNILNEINNKERGYLTTIRRITDLSSELLETLKIIENCICCKDKLGKCNNLDRFHDSSINKIENWLAELEKEKEQKKNGIIRKLNNKLIYINDELKGEILCESCKRKK